MRQTGRTRPADGSLRANRSTTPSAAWVSIASLRCVRRFVVSTSTSSSIQATMRRSSSPRSRGLHSPGLRLRRCTSLRMYCTGAIRGRSSTEPPGVVIEIACRSESPDALRHSRHGLAVTCQGVEASMSLSGTPSAASHDVRFGRTHLTPLGEQPAGPVSGLRVMRRNRPFPVLRQNPGRGRRSCPAGWRQVPDVHRSRRRVGAGR